MIVVMAGGSGQVGRILRRAFEAKGDRVVNLTRTCRQAGDVAWDGRTLGPWSKAIEGADLIVNLAGRSVNCRYHATSRREMLNSRVDSTRVIGQAIAACRHPPSVWLQSSTATIYSHRFDAPNDEICGEIGGNEPDAPDSWKFSIEIARHWERELDLAQTPQTRKLALRSAMIMSPDRGGIFDVLMKLARRGLGGMAGDGRQYVSWIHEADFVSSVDWILARPGLAGVINICSPNPLPNAEFMEHLRNAAGVRVGLPAARWMLEIGAIFMRTETELLLKSRRVVPTRLLRDGFEFRHASWPLASTELAARWLGHTHDPRVKYENRTPT